MRSVDATVIVPTLGRPVLHRTLAALVAGECWPSRAVIADQGAEPADLGALQPWQDDGIEIVHLRFPPAGPAAARNRAIEQVTTPWWVAVDEDCLPAPDWLAKLMARLQQHPMAIVTGRVAPPADVPAAAETPSLIEVPVEQIHVRRSLGADPLHTGNFGVARAVADAIGPFDEQLLAAEDNDWGWRALCRGTAIVTAPDVMVVHDDGRGVADRLAVERRYARGQGRFYGKTLRRLDPWIAGRLVRDLVRAPVRLARGIMAGDARQRASGWIWLTHLLPAVIAGFTARPWSERW